MARSKSHHLPPRLHGYTVIEMVIVIVLLGIVAAVVVPRFMAPNAFDEPVARDGLLTTIRAAQQAALGRSEVTFEIDRIGDTWHLEVKDSGSMIRELMFSAEDIVLETGSPAASSDVCSSGFDTAVANDFSLSFDAVGNLSEFTNTGVPGAPVAVDGNFNGVRICLNDTDALSICVSPAGYAHAGNCDA
ncbi:MAG: type II secretion system protein [Gammaproteobacteria bacterium]